MLLLGDGVRLLVGQSSPDSPGLLVSEVEGEVFRLLVELSEVLSLLLVDDGEDSGDGLSDAVAAGRSVTVHLTRDMWAVNMESYGVSGHDVHGLRLESLRAAMPWHPWCPSTSSAAIAGRSFLKPVLAFRANASFAPRPPAPLFASSTEVLTHILVNLLADPPAIF